MSFSIFFFHILFYRVVLFLNYLIVLPYLEILILLSILWRHFFRQKARVALGYRLVQLLRIFRALQTSRVHP